MSLACCSDFFLYILENKATRCQGSREDFFPNFGLVEGWSGLGFVSLVSSPEKLVNKPRYLMFDAEVPTNSRFAPLVQRVVALFPPVLQTLPSLAAVICLCLIVLCVVHRVDYVFPVGHVIMLRNLSSHSMLARGSQNEAHITTERRGASSSDEQGFTVE